MGEPGTRSRRRLRAGRIIGVLIVLLAIIGLSIGIHRHMLGKFDPLQWRRDKSGEVRARMVDDLLRKHPLRGLDQSRVIDLLGPPDDSTTRYGPLHVLYCLGPEPGWISIDHLWLDIEFAGEKVSSVRTRTD